ncbi:MAG: hypothetical protein HY049_12735 [Acidobacteria bacterium]|nr:hypothetical protein [Acidobacteriota bacterium]
MILGILLMLAAPPDPAPASETPWRIVFKNSLPVVKVQDEDAGIFYVKLVFCGDGPVDPNSGRPDYRALQELKTITYGRPIEGKNLPGRAIDISKKELIARKEDDPATLILTDKGRKRTIYEGTVPAGAAWLKVRYDTAIFTRKEGSHFPGARNWIAMPFPLAPEDRWIRLDAVPSPCATRILQIEALVKGTFPDERDFTVEVGARCE